MTKILYIRGAEEMAQRGGMVTKPDYIPIASMSKTAAVLAMEANLMKARAEYYQNGNIGKAYTMLYDAAHSGIRRVTGVLSNPEQYAARLIKKYDTPLEAIQLYYGLKEAGVKAMLEWWDGKKSEDIAISRVKLNIEIDSAYERLTEQQAIHNLEEAMHSFKNGFTTIRIPHIVVRYYLNETVRNIIGIMEGLKANLKTIN
jgi:hypothetical protein